MKSDFLLLGITSLAILAVPLAVLAGSGMPLPSLPATAPVSISASAESKSDADWQTTVIPGGKPAHSRSQPEEAAAPSASPSPAAAAQPRPTPQPTPQPQPDRDSDGAAPSTPALKAFKILNRSTGKVEEVAVLDYVRGAIAAEMPASYHLEALKAQGVAALTYAHYHVREQEANPDPLLKGAGFSADPEKREGYMTEKAAKRFYGENWSYNWRKVCKAADEAVKWVMLYEGEPIAAAYHAISTGTTEDAINIWEQPLPCLVSVDSSGDILAKGYKSSVTLSQSELKEKLKAAGVTLLPNADSWLHVEERSPADYVTRVQVGNQEMSGNRLRNLLGLRSSSFQIERQGKDFLFLVRGYGHGAGLSQNGADYMARQGSSYRDILEHYYPGSTLARLTAG